MKTPFLKYQINKAVLRRSPRRLEKILSPLSASVRQSVLEQYRTKARFAQYSRPIAWQRTVSLYECKRSE
ncbi:hypothetical protein CHISP_0938 [Chitinispirillum alkaliphilum]|nr:hypothetical protein CHISP_0938 [Chitinispirillum alkaliphilum]